ncbi:MAG: DUF3467 domain-containing protein [Planctomycetaceae bacterium]|nr:DUF3467 domain-containing protein [Planctomycetaceae bacterium]
MSTEPNDNPDETPPNTINQQIAHNPVAARIPQGIGRGVFSTGAIVFEGPTEAVIDFVQRLGQPHQIAARIVMSHTVFAQFINALKENLKMFSDRFGPPPELPKPPAQATQQAQQNQNTISDLYDQLKLPDEMLSGVYGNAVMIGHSPAEFWFDFITNFFPRSAVSARVYMSAHHVPGLLDTLNTSYQAHLRKREGNGGQPPQ